jgi:hypothetical protein
MRDRSAGNASDGATPLLPSTRALLAIASFLSIGIGIPLIVFSDYTDRFFLWPVDPPLSAAFLGACYLAGGVFELVAARQRTWEQARIAVPGVLTFSLITLAITLSAHERLDLLRPAAAPWVIVYTAYPAATALLWRRQMRARGQRTPDPGPADTTPASVLPPVLRLAMILAGAGLVASGLALLAFPEPAGRVWPWDPSPPGAYADMAGMEPYFAAWLIGLGAVALHSAIENRASRLRPMFAGALALGLALALLLPRSGGVIEWERPSAWIFTIAIAALLALGGWGLRCGGRAAPGP